MATKDRQAQSDYSDTDEPSAKRQRREAEEDRKEITKSSVDSASSNRVRNNEDSNKDDPSFKTTVVYIGGLHPTRIVRAHIEKLMKPYGQVDRIHLAREGGGYAFCQFTRAEDARAAMQALDGRTLLGKTLAVRPAHSQQHSRNIPWQLSSQQQQTTKQGSEEERKRVEEKIAAVKRKLKQSQS